MINLIQNNIYIIIFIIVIIIALCFLGNILIKNIVHNEIKNIYKSKKKRKRYIRRKLKPSKAVPNQEINIQPNNIIEPQMDIDNQSYLDPIGMPNQSIEYQNYNNSTGKENILMRDIMDNTPNNRYQ